MYGYTDIIIISDNFTITLSFSSFVVLLYFDSSNLYLKWKWFKLTH